MFDIWCDTFKRQCVLVDIKLISGGNLENRGIASNVKLERHHIIRGLFFINMGILPIVLSLKKDTLGENWGQDMSPGCYDLC